MKSSPIHNLGLPEKMTSVYLVTLGLGSASVQEIARRANLKRPTVYIYLADLIAEGLMEKIPNGKKELYRAKDPAILEMRAQQQLTQIQAALPELQSLRQSIQGQPHLTILEGKKALEQVYAEMTKANSICFWSDISVVERNFPDVFARFAEAIKHNEIRCRDIITNTPEAKKSCKRYAVTAGKTYSARLATYAGIQNDSAIYNDTVALFRIYQHNFFVIFVKEPTIASTMKVMFEMAWSAATPFVGRA